MLPSKEQTSAARNWPCFFARKVPHLRVIAQTSQNKLSHSPAKWPIKITQDEQWDYCQHLTQHTNHIKPPFLRTPRPVFGTKISKSVLDDPTWGTRRSSYGSEWGKLWKIKNVQLRELLS